MKTATNQKRYSRNITATLLIIIGTGFIIGPFISENAWEYMSIIAPALLIPAGIIIGINKWENRLAKLIIQDIKDHNQVWFSSDKQTHMTSTILTTVEHYEVKTIHLVNETTKIPEEGFNKRATTIIGEDYGEDYVARVRGQKEAKAKQ